MAGALHVRTVSRSALAQQSTSSARASPRLSYQALANSFGEGGCHSASPAQATRCWEAACSRAYGWDLDCLMQSSCAGMWSRGRIPQRKLTLRAMSSSSTPPMAAGTRMSHGVVSTSSVGIASPASTPGAFLGQGINSSAQSTAQRKRAQLADIIHHSHETSGPYSCSSTHC
jgi:hypothetical protein